MSQSNADPQIKYSGLLPSRKFGVDADARRSRLREFQSHLLERMEAARSGGNTHQNRLGLLIGGQRWLLSLEEAGEIVAVDRIAKVPLTQDWYLGLTNIRGSLISVVDFACFQGHPITVIDKETRIIAFGNALAFNSALLVSRVLGLRNVDEMLLQPVLQPISQVALVLGHQEQSTGSLANTTETSVAQDAAQYLDNESHLWTELKLTQVINTPRFLHIGI